MPSKVVPDGAGKAAARALKSSWTELVGYTTPKSVSVKVWQLGFAYYGVVAGIIFFENTKGHAAPVPGEAVAEAEAEAEVEAEADASFGASPTTPADGKAGAWGFGPTSPEPAGGADVDVRRKLSLLFDAFDFMQAGPATRIPPPHPALYPFKLHPTPT